MEQHTISLNHETQQIIATKYAWSSKFPIAVTAQTFLLSKQFRNISYSNNSFNNTGLVRYGTFSGTVYWCWNNSIGSLLGYWDALGRIYHNIDTICPHQKPLGFLSILILDMFADIMVRNIYQYFKNKTLLDGKYWTLGQEIDFFLLGLVHFVYLCPKTLIFTPTYLTIH